MHVAGYGPKALAVAGRQGDGVIIQLADRTSSSGSWTRPESSDRGRARSRRAQVHRQRAEPHLRRPRRRARAGALVPGDGLDHVQDLIDRYGTDGSVVPKVLTDYVEARKFYDYSEHSRVGAKHGEFVTDEICDRFCVLGTSEQATEKLRELESIGVDQFNIYLMTHGQEETLEAYGKDILPQFSGVAA